MIEEATHLLLSLLLLFQTGAAGVSLPLRHSIAFTQIPFQKEARNLATGHPFLLNQAAVKGSRIVCLSPDGSLRVLTPEFTAAADPSVSFDGRRILFAGQRSPGDPWNIWEMDVDGGNQQQITRDLGDCREPEYLAMSSITPPDFEDKVRWIVYTAATPRINSGNGMKSVSSLFVTAIQPVRGLESFTWRTSFNLSSDFSPTVLRDGRVLFTSVQEAVSSPAVPAVFPLLAANWDGTGLNLFCSGEQGMPFKTMACETPERTLVFVESAHSETLGGQLARVSFRRPLHSYERLSRDNGWYLNPRSFSDGRLGVSYTSGQESYGIHLFDLSKGEPAAKIFDDPNYEDVDAVPVIAGPEPQGLISSVVDSLQWGDLHCMNVNESDRPLPKQASKSGIARARFIQGMPAHASAGNKSATASPTQAGTRFLGEVPVEPDGSFFVRVPSDTPLNIELLDGNGRVVRRMSRWIWVRSGTSRGCVGCHENKELAPENRVTDAIKKGSPHNLQIER